MPDHDAEFIRHFADEVLQVLLNHGLKARYSAMGEIDVDLSISLKVDCRIYFPLVTEHDRQLGCVYVRVHPDDIWPNFAKCNLADPKVSPTSVATLLDEMHRGRWWLKKCRKKRK